MIVFVAMGVLSHGAPAADAADKNAATSAVFHVKPQSRGEVEEIVARSSLAISANPNNAKAYRERALANCKMEHFASARADLEKVVKISPHTMDAESYQALGECYAQDGDLPKAIDSFSKAIALTVVPKLPASDWRHTAPTYLLAGRYLRRGQAFAAMDKYPEALKDADKVVSLSKEQKELYWPYEFRGRLNLSCGRYGDAVSDYTRAIKISPNISLFSERARAYEKLGDRKSAMLDRQHVMEESKKGY